MDEIKINKSLKNAFDVITPNVLDNILEKTANNSADISHNSPEKVLEMPKRKKTGLYTGLIAACLVLGFGLNGFLSATGVDSIISIDVNPSIQINANKSDKIIEAIAINPDGQKVLAGMNLKNVDLNIGVNAILGSMVKNGYVSDVNSILVSVQNDNNAKAQTLKTNITAEIDSTLASKNLNSVVYNQVVPENHNRNLQKQASNSNISYGKAILINNIMAKDSSLTFDSLAAMSIREISVLVAKKNIDISDIVDYDYDDSITDNLDDAVDDYNENYYENPANNVVPGTGNILNTNAVPGTGNIPNTNVVPPINYNNDRYDDDKYDDKYDNDKYDDDKYDNDDKYDKYDD